MKRLFLSFLILIVTGFSGVGGAAQVRKADVVIYGGTCAAVTAAVQAERMGKSVVIVCPEKHLGGLSSGGLGFTDTGDKSVIGGLSREFYHRIWQHYQNAGVALAEARRVRQPGPGHAGHRSGEADDVDLRAARGRASVRGLRRGAQDSRLSRRMARPADRRAEGRHAHRLDHDAQRQDLQRPDVHRRHLRGRPDGRGRRQLSRRPRGERALRRDVEWRPDRRAPPRPLLQSIDQSLRGPGRSGERPAAADRRGAAGRERAGGPAQCRPIASACA